MHRPICCTSPENVNEHAQSQNLPGRLSLTVLLAPSSVMAAADDGKEILYWVAPMDANYRRDKPGKSPMGMDLVPVYADAAGSGGGITIAPEVVQNLGVRTAVAERYAPVARHRYRRLCRLRRIESSATSTCAPKAGSKILPWIRRRASHKRRSPVRPVFTGTGQRPGRVRPGTEAG